MCPVLAERLVVDDEAAREVEEDAARPHPGELLLAEDAAVAGPPVDVQRHDVALGQQLVQGAAPTRVAQRQPVGGVVEQDPHAERLGEHRQLAADVAVADDAEPAPTHLVAADGGLVPDPSVHVGVLVGQPAGQRDQLGDRELDDAAGVGEGSIEDRDAAL